ncbi:SAM-dependent methyltransferase [Comamonas sp.]|uniref:SAM-dependent methyltransferase n=1 Tax=Comamonas sp. TaxID=34028 RepID=UPI0028A9CD08|nr:SAM-dependent methyltransferase [Comamonas sp.]
MQVSTDVLAVLSAAQVDGPNVLLVGQLDRALYTKTNKVLEAAGGKWNKKAKAHVFDGDASERIEQVILTGSIEIPKDEFNFFPSPPAVVHRLLELAKIETGMRVLEPSAGDGAIAWACAAGGALVDCYEIQQGNAFFLAMNAPHELGKTTVADFLTVGPEPVYDRVVMNPPFLKQADIKHVMHAHQFLKPGGLLVAVMAAGVTFRTDSRTQAFNELVQDRGGHIEPLPENSFKSSGTGVNTVIAVIPA